ncbi:unnamed protein product [Caenorhabditis auriculariae]|uniref:Uncharacterized protein n=1 Tax=Caenorhabditis auriculariae TaxID=2777116 RepID=A0A8S1GM82_9PELO|nr:unnamed protein product [Caenorhabditis auriculariae]
MRLNLGSELSNLTANGQGDFTSLERVQRQVRLICLLLALLPASSLFSVKSNLLGKNFCLIVLEFTTYQ